MQDTTTIAVFGAGGNMGTRVTNALRNEAGYRMLNVEKSEQGRTRLRERGLEVSEQEDALREADVAILAVPDALIGEVATSIVPDLKSGAMLICLDPAAPYAGKLPEREDVSYFITHPAHPSVFDDEIDEEARRDFFDSGRAKEAIESARMQGPDSDYAKGERIWRYIVGRIS